MRIVRFFLILIITVIYSCSKDDSTNIIQEEKKSNEKEILTLELEFKGTTYPILVDGSSSIKLLDSLPYGTKELIIKKIKISPKATVNRNVGDTIVLNESPISFKVTAEDGTSKNYIVLFSIEEKKSNEKSIIKLELEAEGLTYIATINEFSIEIPEMPHYCTRFLKIKKMEISAKATVDKNVGDIINLNETPISLTVTAEDRTSKNYNVNFSIKEKSKKSVVNILIDDSGEHAKKVKDVIINKLVPADLSPYYPKNFPNYTKSDTLFDLNKDISYCVTGHTYDPNPHNILVDILNKSSSLHHFSSAKKAHKELLNKKKFPVYPLVVTSAGNGGNICSEFAYNFALENGGLSFHDHIAPFYNCDPSGTADGCPKVAHSLYKACDIGVAYIIKQTNYAENYIIVGSSSGYGQKPGPILKSRWISTHYQFTYNDGGPNIQGTSFSTPFVAKIAAEIKRRAPEYSNDDIAQLIFTTAHDAGEPGVDEIYGNGVLNPKGIFDELTRRGY